MRGAGRVKSGGGRLERRRGRPEPETRKMSFEIPRNESRPGRLRPGCPLPRFRCRLPRLRCRLLRFRCRLPRPQVPPPALRTRPPALRVRAPALRSRPPTLRRTAAGTREAASAPSLASCALPARARRLHAPVLARRERAPVVRGASARYRGRSGPPRDVDSDANRVRRLADSAEPRGARVHAGGRVDAVASAHRAGAHVRRGGVPGGGGAPPPRGGAGRLRDPPAIRRRRGVEGSRRGGAGSPGGLLLDRLGA